MLKVIAFDLFGTLLDLSNTPREEIKHYLRQCVDPVWKPLDLPDSWKELKAYPGVKEGIVRLNKKFRLTTCSNAPSGLTQELLRRNEIEIKNIAVLAQIQRYKPHPECYLQTAGWCGVEPEEVLMVTANPTFAWYPFGDIEIAGAVGMDTQLIRTEECPDVIALAELLGC